MKESTMLDGHQGELAKGDEYRHRAGDKRGGILFPFIRMLELKGASEGACFGSIQNPIRAMRHVHVGALLKELRVLTDGDTPSPDACGSYRALFMGLQGLEEDLHLHIYLENHVLFPRAIEREEAVGRG